jgi:PAS domain S-box-containing protein
MDVWADISILDTLPVAAGRITSASGEIRYLNPAMAELLGGAPGKFAGMTLTDLLGSELPDSAAESTEVILGDGPARRIVEVRMGAAARPDRASGSADRGGSDMVTFVLQDLTEQRQAERNLAELAQFPEKNPGPGAVDRTVGEGPAGQPRRSEHPR